jgi:hypothetical protein
VANLPVPGTILRALARETLERLRLAQLIEHPGESGRAREQILTAFIEQLIPSSFGVSTGFVVDAVGGKSRQLDVVVYRTDYAPVFEIGGVKHFLVESVVAVVQVKAGITSTAELEAALENIRSVKALDRTNRNRNYRLIGDMRLLDDPWGGKADPEEFYHQVFGAIVTERSLSQDTFVDRYLAWLRAHPRREWPNLYVDANDFVAGYLSPMPPPLVGERLSIVPAEARQLTIFRPKEEGEAPLLELGFEFVNWFRMVPKIDFLPTDYLAPGMRWTRNYPLE